ncbi:MAG: hypothetical protein WA708_01865 [Acidobacteriaceae bacterium]
MKLRARIDEAIGLTRDIQADLSQVSALCGARNPERSLEYLGHLHCVTIYELLDQVVALTAHYERHAKKAGAR